MEPAIDAYPGRGRWRMTSYSKRMMQVAAEWRAANPDPKETFLRMPGFGKARPGDMRADGRDVDIARYEAEMRRDPTLAAKIGHHVADLRRLTAERRETQDSVYKAEVAFIEEYNKAPRPKHDKHVHYDHVMGRWALSWARHGYNVFDLSPDFAAAMLLTDPRELDIASVRMPFDGVLILLPDGFARGVEGRHYTKVHVWEVSGQDIHVLGAADKVNEALADLPIEDARRILRDLEADSLPKPKPTALVGAGMRMGLGLPNLATAIAAGGLQTFEARSMVDAGPPGIPSDLAPSPSFCIYATDGVNAISTTVDRNGLTWDALEAIPDAIDDDADKQVRRTLAQIVFGAFAYIGAVEHGMEPRAEPGRRRRDRGEAELKHWDVGRTIKIGPTLVRAARAGSREVALRLKHRHIVRGHYRDQAHGTARALRKKIWIMPFWKGPEDGAALVHTYKLDEGTPE